MKKRWKRILAGVLSLAMLVTASPMIPGKTVSAEALPGLADLGRQVAAEGIVLLENPDVTDRGNSTGKVLPVAAGETVSVFGRSQLNYYKSGTGSGGAVQVEYVNGIMEGLRTNPNIKVNEELAQIYEDWVAEHPFDDGGGGWAAEPWSQVEMELDEETVADAEANSDVAVVIIGRTAGEDKDNSNTKGAYLLSDLEVDMLDKVHAAFDKMVVVLNVGNVIDMSWAADYPKAAILYTWQGGMKGGDAVADVISGDVTPSGKLSDTIAIDISDYPSEGTFEGNTLFGSSSANYYAEDIYVGYRYFETFAQDRVLYPFGYGLSYTTFDIATNGVTFADGEVKVDVTVTNTGSVKGKEVVQVYYGAPQGVLGKPAKELAAFAKTGILQPGESQSLSISYDISEMSSYDDSGATGVESAYVMEAGDYKIYVGTSVRNSSEKAVYTLDEMMVTEQLSEAMVPVRSFKRMKPVDNGDGTYSVGTEEVPYKETSVAQAALDERIAENQPEELTQTEKQYKLIDVYNGDIDVETFVAQMTDSDLASVVLGEGMNSTKVTLGTASCFGGVTNSLLELGLPIACCADGPSGIRMEVGVQYATSLPNGTLIACTWNTDLVEKMSELWGQEMLLNNIDTILGPGINIHRHPLNGRNFEYFSEDPLLTGIMASAQTKGVQKSGATVTIKHFAANNQEKSRHYVDSVVSERALREIYLKGYEIAVKDGNVRSIMTSYNPINGVWAASNYDMNTTILRNEWGYTGFVMTDWWARMNATIGGSNSTSDSPSMVRAQNDVYMPVGNNTAGSCSQYTNGLAAITASSDVRAQYQRSAINICNYLLQTPAFARTEGIDLSVTYEPGEEWFSVTRDISVGDPKLTGITVGGRELKLFNENILDYEIFYNVEDGEYPEVAGIGEGVEISVQQANADTNAAILTVTQNKEERIYKIIFSTADGLEPAFEDPTYALLDGILVDGEPLGGFEQNKFSYTMGIKAQDGLPTIEAVTSDGISAAVSVDESTKTVSIRCVSTDQANTYKIKFGNVPQSDEFDSTTLNSVWQNNDPTENVTLTEKEGYLRIKAEGGDFYKSQNNIKNLIYQEAFGDWEAVARVELNKQPDTNYNGMGIMAFQDIDNYVWMKFDYSSYKIVAMSQEVNAATPVMTGTLSPEEIAGVMGDSTVVYLKLKKFGDVYTGYISPDGETYTKVASVAAVFEEPKFGLMCSNGSTNPDNEFVADYDYVRFNEEPEAAAIEIDNDTKIKFTEEEPYYISEALTVTTCNDVDGGNMYTDCNEKESLAYRVNVLEDGTYRIKLRVKSDLQDLAQMSVSMYDGDQYLTTYSTNGTNSEWITLSSDQELSAGEHVIWLKFDKSGLDMNWMRFQLVEDTELDTANLEALIAEAEAIDFTKYMAATSFESVLTYAKEVLAEAVNQAEIEEAEAIVQEALDGLTDSMPIKQEPEVVEETKADGKLTKRIWFHNLPWIWTQSDTFRFEGSSPNYNAGYITEGDIFYFGYMDLTGLEEIRLNYANGNTSSNQYQPSVRLNFYTQASSTDSPSKTTVHANSTYAYDGVYTGGTINLSNYFAGMNFLHKKQASWTIYGDASTNGDINDAGIHPGMTNYWEVGAKTFLTAQTGMNDVFMHLYEGGANMRYAEFVYDLSTVSFDLNYDGAEAAEVAEVVTGTTLGEAFAAEPEREGYFFDGWAAEDGTVITAETVVKEDMTVYAQWTAEEDTQSLRTSLTNLYEAWADKDLSEYTEESAAVLTEALAQAKTVLDNERATAAEISQAVNTLVRAIAGLTDEVQKVHLETAIACAEEVIAAENASEVKEVAAAVEKGKLVLDNAAATQEEVDAATNAILDALAAILANRTVLDALIEAAENMVSDKYTSDSKAALEEAIAAAKDVAANQGDDQAALEQAYTNLLEAVIGLQMKGNKAALNAIIAKAEMIVAAKDSYVASTLEGLEEALAAAKAVQADEDAVQAEIDAEVKALTTEAAQVRLLGDVNGDGAVTTSDSTAVLRAAAEYTELSDVEAESADVNRDGVATTADAVLILQYSAEMISGF